MGLAEVKNEVKTLFLILNTLFGLLPGLLAISAGIAMGVSTEPQYGGFDTVGIIWLGIVMLGIAGLGYCGSIKENKVMLYVFSGLTTGAAVSNIVVLLLMDTKYISVSYTAMMILDLALMVLTLTLAIILARTGRRSGNQGCVHSPAPAPPYTPNI